MCSDQGTQFSIIGTASHRPTQAFYQKIIDTDACISVIFSKLLVKCELLYVMAVRDLSRRQRISRCIVASLASYTTLGNGNPVLQVSYGTR